MHDASASPRHRIDAAKALDDFAANGPEAAPAADRFQIMINLGSRLLEVRQVDRDRPQRYRPQRHRHHAAGVARGNRGKKQRTTAVVSLFERLDKGRPPPTEEPIKQPRRRDDRRTFLLDVLANGPVPATLIEERGAAHGFSRKQLRYARGANEHCCFQRGGRRNGRWFWRLGGKRVSPGPTPVIRLSNTPSMARREDAQDAQEV